MWDVAEWLDRVRIVWPETALAAWEETEEHADDVALACACALGDRLAIAAFEAAYGSTVRAVLGRMKLGPDGIEEVLQSVREKLFAERPPRITSYAGAGALNAWVRAVVTREAIDLHRRAARQVSLQ